MAVLSVTGAFLRLSFFLSQRAMRVFKKRQAPFSWGKKEELITRSGEFLKASLFLSQKKHERETSLSRAWQKQPILLQEQLVGETRRLCPTRSGCLMVGLDAHEQCPNVNDTAVIRVKSWMQGATGRFYMYYASHHGGSIRLAISNTTSGPWKTSLKLRLRPQELGCNSLHSPDIFVDAENRRVLMFIHGHGCSIGNGSLLFNNRPSLLCPVMDSCFLLSLPLPPITLHRFTLGILD